MKILAHLSGGYDSVATCLKLLNEGHEVTGLFFNLEQDYVENEFHAVKYVNFLLRRFCVSSFIKVTSVAAFTNAPNFML